MDTLPQLLETIESQMIFIEGDTFDMGSQEHDSEKPIHSVTIPSFYLSKNLITNEQFLPFLLAKGNREEGGVPWVNLEGNAKGVRCGIQQGANGLECVAGLEQHPMVYVSWYGAKAYCDWLSAQTDYKTYRLPSEAEWEYAARGGQYKSPFQYSGSNHVKEVAWFNENSFGETKPVGLKLSNALGLYDMSGNVWEWCADHWHENYKGAPDDGSAWVKGGQSDRRVVRGGSWSYDDGNCRVSYRNWDYTDGWIYYVGFRVARY